MSQTEKTVETIDLKSVDRLAQILGAFDENLNFLSRELGIVGYVDGVKIRLEGDTEGVRVGLQVLHELSKMASSGETVDIGRMAYCIELAKEGRAGEIST